MLSGNGSRFFMGMQIASSRTMLQSNQIAIAHKLNGIRAVPQWCWLIELLDEPPVVTVFMRISRDLLLLSANSGWVEMHMRMQITTTSDTVFQSQQRSVRHLCLTMKENELLTDMSTEVADEILTYHEVY